MKRLARPVPFRSAALAALFAALACVWAVPAEEAKKAKAPEAPPPEAKEAKNADFPRALTKPAPENVADLKAIQEQVKKVLQKVVPCTVGLQVGGASGSGVIVSADGYVLTAAHVSGKPGRAVTLILHDGRTVKGKTLGANRGMDSGLIKITDKGKWPFVPMGDSAALKVGQWCISTGHPGGYKKGRSPVVRLGRVVTADARRVRTDCTLVGGDSGGPLFDLAGRVIGIHASIGPSISSNFHVPVDTYKATWERLVASESWGGGLFGGGRPDAPFMGAHFDENAKNCKIAEVRAGSPAEKAGLKPNDVVLKIDNHKVGDVEELRGVLRKKKAGEEITLEVQRGEETKNIKLTLGKVPSR
jgi:serine protease Do